MTYLRDLDMSGNSFNSTIPNSWLSSLSCLENLNLGYNNLEGAIPTAIGNLTSLTRLDLSSNQLKGRIPSSLGNLCNLREIDLLGNSFAIDVSDVLESFSGCVLNGLESLQFGSSQHG
uniref:Uncharacterized protein n=1 Tax=Davidia involucrata TaxID=16924 RepID=A0A5B7BZ00_DAVIN